MGKIDDLEKILKDLDEKYHFNQNKNDDALIRRIQEEHDRKENKDNHND